MPSWRKAAKVAAFAVPAAFAVSGATFRYRNRPQLPNQYNLQSLQGRTVILTGGTSGIGQSAVRNLLGLGAHVIVGARNSEKGRALLEDAADTHFECHVLVGNRQGKLEVLPLDLCSPRSIVNFADEAIKLARSENGGLHAIIHVAAEIRVLLDRTRGGVDVTFFTNHIGPQYLTNCLVPELTLEKDPQEGRHKKIIIVGSRLERRGKIDLDSLRHDGVVDPAMIDRFDAMKNYASSKLANMLLAQELRRQLHAFNAVDILVVSPGMVNTGLWKNFPAWYRAMTYPVRATFLRTPDEAAQGIMYATAAQEAEGLSEYICDGHPLECSDSAKDGSLARSLYEVCESIIARESSCEQTG